MNTTQTKLTTIERRAFNFCQHLLNMNGGNIGVEWKKSAMYGYNPVIDFNGKCTNVSGCGYDKLSTALADCLRFLFPSNSEDHRAVWTTGGCGEFAFELSGEVGAYASVTKRIQRIRPRRLRLRLVFGLAHTPPFSCAGRAF